MHPSLKAKQEEIFDSIFYTISSLDKNQSVLQSIINVLFDYNTTGSSRTTQHTDDLIRLGKRAIWHGLISSSFSSLIHSDLAQAIKITSKIIKACITNLHEL